MSYQLDSTSDAVFTATDGTYAWSGTTSGGTTTVAGVSGNSVSGSTTWWTDLSTSGYIHAYVNGPKAKAIMLQLHPDTAWSDWAVRLWDERRDDLGTTSVPNVQRAQSAKIFFVVHMGELLVAAKSWATAVRCAAVLDIINP